MKVGFRKPNIKKSIKARTTGKIKRKMKKAINPLYGKKGMGFIKNPKKSIQNKIYHQTTIGVSDVLNLGSNTSNNNKQKNNSSKQSATNQNSYVIQANNDIKIIQDSIKLLSETLKPDIFFSKLDLLKNTANHLQQLEPYINFSVSPTQAFAEVLRDEQDAIYQFIIRYYNSVKTYADTLKTDKGKANQYQKFYDTLMNYRNVMNEENIKYIEYKYKQSINR